MLDGQIMNKKNMPVGALKLQDVLHMLAMPEENWQRETKRHMRVLRRGLTASSVVTGHERFARARLGCWKAWRLG